MILVVLLLSSVLAVHGQGGFFDFSEGMINGFETNCLQANGVWAEEDAVNYQAGQIPGPQEGKVLVSQSRTLSCLRIPGRHHFTEGGFKFKIKFYVPTPSTATQRKFLVYFVPMDESKQPTAISSFQPTTAGWSTIELTVPAAYQINGPYQVELWTTNVVEYLAVRWFGISNEEMPPPATTTTTTTTTTTSTTTPTSVATEQTNLTSDPTPESTTELTGQTDSSSPDSTEPMVESTTTSPTTTTTPPIVTTPPTSSIFPDLWSVLLGVAIGIMAMSLVMFVAMCFWWIVPAKRKKGENIAPLKLPRLKVVSSSSQKSITGSLNSNSGSTDPFWVKSKGWSHIP